MVLPQGHEVDPDGAKVAGDFEKLVCSEVIIAEEGVLWGLFVEGLHDPAEGSALVPAAGELL